MLCHNPVDSTKGDVAACGPDGTAPRLGDLLGVELPERISTWLARLEQRPSIAAEVELVRSL